MQTYDFEWWEGCTEMGDTPIELRAHYTRTPAIKWGLETEPMSEEYEVITIVPIFVGGESGDRRVRAHTAASRAMKMYVDGGCDQFHSVLRNL
ncbi:MAG: hypothetical protein GY941_05025 [Planctomycetes bacterium]|nr:hypothetical protein [Planctomycetota bacterium]